MTRADILAELDENGFIPTNYNGLVVTKSNVKGTGFLRTSYDERYLDAYMD
jgi:hypothetical protein